MSQVLHVKVLSQQEIALYRKRYLVCVVVAVALCIALSALLQFSLASVDALNPFEFPWTHGLILFVICALFCALFVLGALCWVFRGDLRGIQSIHCPAVEKAIHLFPEVACFAQEVAKHGRVLTREEGTAILDFVREAFAEDWSDDAQKANERLRRLTGASAQNENDDD